MSRSRGFSLFEVLVALSIFALLSTIAISNLKVLQSPVVTGAAELVSFFKAARAKAISTTMAYTVKATSSTSVVTTYAKTCSTTPQTDDATLALTLPRGATLANTGWSVCYNTRGIGDTSIDIDVRDGAVTKTVQVVLGGGVRIKP